MTSQLRIPREIYCAMLADLTRPHHFAYERVGFCRVKLGNKAGSVQIILVTDYWPVSDEHYLPDDMVGARINGDAIRDALQKSLSTGDGIFHVHLHNHEGVPFFSSTDHESIPKLLQSLTNVSCDAVHGMLLLSQDRASAKAIFPSKSLVEIERISIIGSPTQLISKLGPPITGDRFDRQSFLGREAPVQIQSLKVGIIGLSGGGSHAAQQCAHLGFERFAVFDKQTIDGFNSNRLVGATQADVENELLKVDIAQRVIKSINRFAVVEAIASNWQEEPTLLRSCDIVIGAVDGFEQRWQLEAACRRFLIPLIDVGMDVKIVNGQKPRMAGQVILSMPGHPCMQCIGFLNESNLTAEAARYGDAGPNPQVVWPNGVLVSTAVGILVELATSWNQSKTGLIYKSYDGNSYNLTDHPRFEYVRHLKCSHYSFEDLGDI